MIPYAVLCGKVYSEDGTETDIRVLELSGDSFSFRLPKSFCKLHGEHRSIELNFFDWKSKSYRGVCLEGSADGTDCRVTEAAEYYEVYTVSTKDNTFKELSQELTKDYLKYIDCKLNLADEEVSAKMAGYPAEQEEVFAVSYSEQIKHLAGEIMNGQEALKSLLKVAKASKCEMCLSIENTELVDMYLRMRIDEFVVSLFKKNHLENHPFSHSDISRIYIGNEYCCNMRFEPSCVQGIIEKATQEGLAVTLALAPVSALKYREHCEYIDSCIRMLKEAGAKAYEICVNDLGMYEYVQTKYKDIPVVRGCLMNKYRRDPRLKYAPDIKDGRKGEAEAISYYPYYQTNTGTFCPLRAAVCNKSRGDQERVDKCSHVCRNKAFVYPKHLNMLGKYNSIFGVKTDGYSNEPERVVINL